MINANVLMWVLIALVVIVPLAVDVLYKFETTKKIFNYYFVESMDEFIPHGLHAIMELSILVLLVTICRVFKVPDYLALGAAALIVWRGRPV